METVEMPWKGESTEEIIGFLRGAVMRISQC
jgi:hypothetical protein